MSTGQSRMSEIQLKSEFLIFLNLNWSHGFPVTSSDSQSSSFSILVFLPLTFTSLAVTMAGPYNPLAQNASKGKELYLSG